MIENSKILIVVPHQDDEINLCGGLIKTLSNKKLNNIINVVYITNGDYASPVSIRYNEVIRALKVLGVKKENAIFLGYGDQKYTEKTHMYNLNNSSVWISNAKKDATYSNNKFNTWSFNKHGKEREYLIQNVQKDLEEIILNYLPNIIIGIDNDFHPDHLMTSLVLEKAIGQVLKENIMLNGGRYTPLVLKGFAYENAYNGSSKYFTLNDYGMQFEVNNNGIVKHNRYYSINDSIAIKIDKNTYTKNIFKNILLKALLKHKSELIIKKADGIIASNNVFFQRRTDNLLLNSDIITSSGDSNYLNDYILLDTYDVLDKKDKEVIFDRGIWIPDLKDDKKEIKITLKKSEKISKIIFYHGLKNIDKINNINNINNIKITYVFENKEEIIEKYSLLDHNIKYLKGENPNISVISFDENKKNNFKNSNLKENKIKEIIIKILDEKIENGFSEIEIFSINNEKSNFEKISNICKLKVGIGNTWTNNYYTESKTEFKKIVLYNKNKLYTDKNNNINNNINIISELTNGNIVEKDNEYYIEMNNNTKGRIIVEYGDFKDIININKCRNLRKINNTINKYIYKFIVNIIKVIKVIYINPKIRKNIKIREINNNNTNDTKNN